MNLSRKLLELGVLVLILASLGDTHFVQAAILESDLNQNGVLDNTEQDVVMNASANLPAGEYNFNNLTITNYAILTLDGDPNSTDTFKGVKINVNNLTVDSGAQISADGKGYVIGPGTPDVYGEAGASYGGMGGGASAKPAYGSAKIPTELGSGTEGNRGGGAIRLIVSNILKNNGRISAEGSYQRTSGGSIYVTAGQINGNGVFSANGTGSGWPVGRIGGAGGRVALYYQNSSFSGIATASAGTYCFYGCAPAAEAGTVGFFDIPNNNLNVFTSWHFQKNDSPFNFQNIIFKNGAKVTAEGNIDITSNTLLIDQGSSVVLYNNPILNVTNITLDGSSSLTLSGSETINTDTFLVSGSSTVSVIPEKILTLKIPNITVDSGAQISADGKGYVIGPGTPDVYGEAGASYGGMGGGASAKPAYGSAKIPTELGSGTEGNRGGGAIRLIVSGTLQNNGRISADGYYQRTSGGSIYVTAGQINGNGVFSANGTGSGWPVGRIGGAGGRIAIYYQNSSFTGTATASAGTYCFYGCAPAAEDGTVVMNTSGPVCTVDCFSNVLFLPGIMGSRLYEQSISGDNQLWVSIFDSDHADLVLDNQGKSINNIYTKNDTKNHSGEIDEIGIVDDIFSFNIYQSFINDLRKWKDNDKIIEDYDFIPYDWRLSLDDIITNGSVSGNDLFYNTPKNFSESFILKKLEALQSNSRTGKVTIIAHSNGGLVAKALIQKLKDTNNPLYDKIDKVILIAVPQVGTPDALSALLHGNELGHGLIMDTDRSRQLAENMSSIYNFLPSAGYFSTVDPAFAVDKVISFENKPFFNPQLSQYSFFVSNETELKNYVLGTDSRTKPSFSDTVHPNIGNSILYSQAESVHQILDSWQPSPNTKVIQVAGWGEETLAGLDYKAYKNSSGVEYLSYKLRLVVDGDGTVVVPSALWMSDFASNIERWWVDLEKNGNLLINRVHKDILEISNLRDFIKSIIKDNATFTDSDNIVVNNTSTLVSSKTRLHYTLHSPLTLGITDSQGRYTGQDPITKQVREEIPDVNYKQIGDVQFISVPVGVNYTLNMEGYQQGNFSLDVDQQQGNTVTASTSFQGIPSSVSTVATMDITPNFNVANSTLEIDQNGDGTIDKTLNATVGGITIYDDTPPELQTTFDINTKDVVFSAQDIIDPSPTITTTNTSIILKDSSGNTTIIPFTKLRELPTRLRLSYNKVIRNGITTTVPNTNIVYDWQEKKGVLTDLDTKATVKGVEKYVFNYKKANNATIIKEKTSGGIVTTTKAGFVVVTVKTEGDSVKVTY